jgi:hypothetical protein
MLGKENQRAIRPPSARDLFGGEAESALRDWLAQRYVLSERRFVEYLEHRGRSAIKKYRELDAVTIPDRKTIHVFEIKASQKAASLRRAVQQLRDTRTILRMLYPYVYTTVLLVDTGIPTDEEVAALMAGPDAPPAPPPTLREMLDSLPQIRLVNALDERASDPEMIDLLRFGVEDIVALVGAEHLHLDWDEEEADLAEGAEAEEEQAEPGYAYTTEETDPEADEEGGAFGAALRRAMEGRAGNERG